MDDSTRYRTGEWALSGFDFSTNNSVVHYSPHWYLVPLKITPYRAGN
jgi:hypothetical protein